MGGPKISIFSDDYIWNLHHKHELAYVQIHERTNISREKFNRILKDKYAALGIPIPKTKKSKGSMDEFAPARNHRIVPKR